MRVKQVLSKDVVSVHSNDSVREALTLMVENHVTALPVVNGRGVCVGMLSATDLIALTRELDDELNEMRISEVTHQWLIDQISEHDLDRRNVGELMTAEVQTIGPELPVEDAGREMLRHRVHRLPVVREDGRLIGVVSTTDLLAALIGEGPK